MVVTVYQYDIFQDCPNYDNIQKMDYLDRVFSETLRLYAPGGRYVIG